MAIKLSTAHRGKHLILVLILLACYHNSIHVRSYLRRAVLVSPDVSHWQKLYDESDESSFLHITGLTRDAFNATRTARTTLASAISHRQGGFNNQQGREAAAEGSGVGADGSTMMQ